MITLLIVVCALTLAAIGCAVLTPPPVADERTLEAITLSIF